MNEQDAERKVVGILFLSLGSEGRKNLTDRHPYMVISTATLAEMREICDQTIRKQRNRTPEQYKFFPGKQQYRNNKVILECTNLTSGTMRLRKTDKLFIHGFINSKHS